jgi:hypothetical protein
MTCADPFMLFLTLVTGAVIGVAVTYVVTVIVQAR